MRTTAQSKGGTLGTTTQADRPAIRRFILPAGRAGWIGLLTIVVVAAIWWLLTSATGVVPEVRFPSPETFLQAFDRLATVGYAGGSLWSHAVQSVRLVLLGFAAAVVVGVPLGFAMGYDRRVEAFVNPVFLLLRPIPPLAWIPLAIVWLGLTDGSKILVIFVAAFVPSVINTFTGVRNARHTLVEAARVHGATRRRLMLEVYLPGALPLIFTGLKLSMQAAWTTLVAAELVGAVLGLGRVLSSAYRDIDTAMILVAMLAIAILGALTTKAIGWAERRATPWLVQ